MYARSGPSLELHTADDATAEWLRDRLVGSVWLEEEDFERFRSIQCPVGVLVGVEGVRVKGGVAASTTDLLVYGVLSCGERPPTPPGLSSDYAGGLSLATRQELRIYASPLSADVIARAQTFPTPPPRNIDTETLDNDAQFAEFLPDLRSPSPKRKRVASLFESAAQHHKRVRQKGGEAVAQLMAPLQSQSSQQPQNLSKIKRESEEPSVLPALAQRSRSASMKPLDSRPGSNRGHVRGLVSRKNTPTPFVEGSLKREHSPPELLSSDTKQKKEPSSSIPRDPDTTITENKNTITRTILTCMRLYGFSRSSTRPGSTKHPEGLQEDGASTEEDEFKAMYHATYRASTFALRKYLRESVSNNAEESKAVPPLLEKQKAMGYIDEFLRLFCEEG